VAAVSYQRGRIYAILGALIYPASSKFPVALPHGSRQNYQDPMLARQHAALMLVWLRRDISPERPVSRVIPDVTAEKPHDGLGGCRLIRTTYVACPQVCPAGNPGSKKAD
jgi:hypothetical protein